jgi:hypothetical protein
MPCPSEQDFVQDIVASVAMLKANTMRVLWDCTDINHLLGSVQPLQERLRTWYGRLPHAAQLNQQSSGFYVPLKTSIYYAHLLHMGATMLIFRRCIGVLRRWEDYDSLSREHQDIINNVFLSLVREASQSVRHCWITM